MLNSQSGLIPFRSNNEIEDAIPKWMLFSIFFHILIVLSVIIVVNIEKVKPNKETVYLFNMVEPKRRRPIKKEAIKPKITKEVKKIEKKAVKKLKKQKVIKTKSNEKVKEAAPIKKEVEIKEVITEEEAVIVETEEEIIEEAISKEEAPEKEIDFQDFLENELSVENKRMPNYFQMALKRAVERNWTPPRELLGGLHQLVVLVKFTINKNGSISNLEINESSWNKILDNLATRAIEKAIFPPLPPALGQDVTIYYRLVLNDK